MSHFKFNLNVMGWNANGLESHCEELVNFLSNFKPKLSFICIQETHLKSSSSLNIEGYNILSNCRKDRRGGGTAILIDNLIPFRIIEPSNDDIEYTEIETVLVDATSPLRIVSIYLPPNQKIDSIKLSSVFSDLNTVVVGDFNAKNPLWGSNIADARGNTVSKCLLENTNLVCLNTGEPTHLNVRNGSMSHLDLTFCSATLASVSDWCVLDSNLGSDHYPTITSIGKSVPCISNASSSWNLSKADWDGFSSAIRAVLSVDFISHFGTEDFFVEFSKKVVSAALDHIPLHNTSSAVRRLPF